MGSSALLVAFLLSACGGGSESGMPASEQQAPPPSQSNAPPTIEGTPPSEIVAGESYSFSPQAHDPEGAKLTFSIENAPPWSNFSTVTGRLSGTPRASDVGTFANVTIRVSDGVNSVTLPPFTITVTEPASQSATLSWVAPTTRVNGVPLDDLAGYKIRYGRTSQSYDTTIAVNDPSVTRFVIDNLTSGTWYFSITAIDAAGIESSFSDEVSKTIT